MDVFWQDLRHALRTLVHDVGFTSIVVLTLAVGIGVNTAVFTLVRSILWEPLPYADADRLAMVWTDIPGRGVHEAGSAYANVQDWRTLNRVFEDLATFDPTTLTLTGGEWPEQISTALVSANFLSVLGVAPSVGRAFTAEEERRRVPVVVLGHALWQRRFGPSDAIGQAVEIGGRPFEVIGVMPDGFGFPDRSTQAWLPQTVLGDRDAASAARGTGSWRVLGRLRPDVSIARARADMDAIATRLEQLHPADNAGLGIQVVPLYEQVTGQSLRVALWTLFGAVALLLLMACANVTHLILARGMDRAPEFALRAALGATTPRLLRQALTETMVIALTAGVVGFLLAVGALRVLVSLAPPNLPRLNEVGVDLRVLTYTAAVALAVGVLCGIAPALGSWRISLLAALQEGRSFTRRSVAQRARSALIVFQFALAIILVFGANLLIRSLLEARRVDPGFQSENVLMANLSVQPPSDRRAFYERAVQDVQAIPGVRAAAIVEDLFISGAPNGTIAIEGRDAEEPSSEQFRSDAIAGSFFQVLGVPFREGRDFTTSDAANAPPVAIVNETMARRFWGDESAVGMRFRMGPDAPWIEVVGIVGDMHRQGLEREPFPQVFRPYAQAESRNMNLLVRTDAAAPGLTESVRARIAAIDATVPLYSITTVAQALDRYLSQRRFQTFLLGLFAVVALILAAVGIYGLIQFSVARRTREMGVRVALGARSARLVRMILGQALALAVPGLAAGMVCALWLSDAVVALLFGVAPSDPTNIIVTAAILLLTTLAACYIPARRAAGVDPMAALRSR